MHMHAVQVWEHFGKPAAAHTCNLWLLCRSAGARGCHTPQLGWKWRSLLGRQVCRHRFLQSNAQRGQLALQRRRQEEEGKDGHLGNMA